MTTRHATRRARIAISMALGALIVLLLPLVAQRPAADAAGWSITGPTSTLVKVGTPITLDSFVVTSGSPASVSLSVTPPSAGTLTLSCGSTCAGITYDRGDGLADTKMRLTGTRTNVNSALARLRFDPTSLGTANITATVVDGTLGWDPGNEHLYAFVPGTFNWPTSLAAATGSNLYGWQGYLTTITSAYEDSLVSGLIGANTVFLGGTDEVTEGIWKWKGGPQDGLTFWNPICGVGLSGLCLDTGAINNWKTGEPNAFTTNEDYLIKDGSGQWLDTNDTTTCCGYVVEYGGVGTFAPPSATVSITAIDVPPVVNQVQVSPATTTTTTTTEPPTTTTTEPPTTTRPTTTRAATAPATTAPTTTAPTTTKSTTAVPTTTAPGTAAASITTKPATTAAATTRPTAATRTSTTTPTPSSPTPSVTPASSGADGAGNGAAAGSGAGADAGGAGKGDGNSAVDGATASDPTDTTVVAATTTVTGTEQPTTTPTTGPPGGTGATSPSADVTLRLRAAIGDIAAGRRVDFDAHGLVPGTQLQGIVRSTPTVIARDVVGPDGTFHADGTLPDGLAPGVHHLELAGLDGRVLARAAFRVRTDGTIGDADAALDVTGGPYDPLQHVPDALDALVAATVALAVVSGRKSTDPASSAGDGGSDDAAPSGGSVAGLSVAAETTLASGTGWGDRHRTWAAPGTAAIDRWAKAAPARVQRRSAHLARAIAEGAYLRAMVGSIWALLPAAGIVLGAMAWWHGDRDLLSPDWRWIAAALAISTLDGLAGVGAAVVVAGGAILGGHVTDVPRALTVAGLIVLLAGPPAVASAARPIGRLRGRTLADRWDRVTDLVLASALTALAVRGMAGALSGLRGRVLPIADHADRFGIIVLAAVAARVLLESLANNHWPQRRRSCEPPEPPAQTDFQRYMIPTIRGLLFLLASYRFIGINWALLLGAVFTVGPMVVDLEPTRLGHHPWTHRLVLRRLTKWFVLLVVGTYVSVVLADHIHDPHRLLLVGFVVVMIPGVLADLIGSLGHDAEDHDLTWRHRIAGAIAFVIGLLFTFGRLP